MKKLGIILAVLTAFFITGCNSQKSLEKTFKKLTTEYYETNLNDKVIGVTNHKITLQALETSGIDIQKFNKCDSESYVVLKENNNKYELEVHLNCK